MAADRDDPPKPGPQGTVVMQAVIRPAGAERIEAPISSTVTLPAVPDMTAHSTAHSATGPTQMSPLPMTECARCRVLTPVANFCSECGAPLLVKRFCSDCGVQLKAGAKFCEGCGAKVT